MLKYMLLDLFPNVELNQFSLSFAKIFSFRSMPKIETDNTLSGACAEWFCIVVRVHCTTAYLSHYHFSTLYEPYIAP